MEKKVDGIKKGNLKDVAKSRKVVLESIEEEAEKGPQDEVKSEKKSKKLDGIFFANPFLKNKKKKEKKPDSQLAPDFKKDVENIDDNNTETNKDNEQKKKYDLAKKLHQERIEKEEVLRRKKAALEEKANEEILKKENKEKLKLEKEKKEAEIMKQQKIKEEKERIKQEQIRKEKEIQAINKQKKEQERIKQKELEKKEKIKRRKEKIIERQKEKEEKKKNKILIKRRRNLIRKARMNEFKNRYDNFINFIKKQYKIGVKKSVYIFFIAFLIFLLLYFLFIILVVQFNLNTKMTRKISQYLPVPALVIEGSIINYYTYIDLHNSLSTSYQNNDDLNMAIREDLIKLITTEKLSKKYNVTSHDLVKEYFIYDKDNNQVAINRAYKIKEMIKNDDDFVKVGAKYGDEQGRLDFNSSKEASSKFGEGVEELEVGKVSGVLVGNDGYYIVKRFEKNGSEFPVSYIFIGAKTFEQYLDEAVINSKIWSLVD